MDDSLLDSKGPFSFEAIEETAESTPKAKALIPFLAANPQEQLEPEAGCVPAAPSMPGTLGDSLSLS